MVQIVQVIVLFVRKVLLYNQMLEKRLYLGAKDIHLIRRVVHHGILY